jgi:ribosomal protein S2
LSNYISISKSIKKYGSKKNVYKSSIFLKIISNWYVTRFTWPRAVFLANIDSNYVVCSEAISMHIPIISIIDSNVKSYLVKLPIISNDDSMESFYYIFNIISKLILLFKYKKLILWFFKYKRVAKELHIKNLIGCLYNIKKMFNTMQNI